MCEFSAYISTFLIEKIGIDAFYKCDKSNILSISDRDSDSFVLYDKESTHLLINSKNAYVNPKFHKNTDKIQQITLTQSNYF